MAFSKFALLAAAATIASPALAADITPYDAAEINVVVQDINDHLSDYAGLASDSDISIPPAVMQVYAAYAGGDKDYTTLYTKLDMTEVNSLISALPWYSSRLKPEIATIKASNDDDSSDEDSKSKSESATSTKKEKKTSTKSKKSKATGALANGTHNGTHNGTKNGTNSTRNNTRYNSSRNSTLYNSTRNGTKNATNSTTLKNGSNHTTLTTRRRSKTADSNGKAASTDSSSSKNVAGKFTAGVGAGVLAAAAFLL